MDAEPTSYKNIMAPERNATTQVNSDDHNVTGNKKILGQFGKVTQTA